MAKETSHVGLYGLGAVGLIEDLCQVVRSRNMYEFLGKRGGFVVK